MKPLFTKNIKTDIPRNIDAAIARAIDPLMDLSGSAS